jgi:CDP-diacylglycerol--glycerol-3-phosphate 3-phosphatidyltransferase
MSLARRAAVARAVLDRGWRPDPPAEKHGNAVSEQVFAPIRAREVLYPANLLTLARLLLVPLIVRSLQQGTQRRATLLIGAALLTDVIDGPIARARGEVSELGKVLDPVTDKLLLNATALTLARRQGFPAWVAGLLIVRDVAILLGSAAIYRKRTRIEVAQPVGKLTTVAFGLALLLHMLGGARRSRWALLPAIALLAGSAIAYGRTFARVLGELPARRSG